MYDDYRWNKFARVDDEYCLHVEYDTGILMLIEYMNYVECCCRIFRIVEIFVMASLWD